MDDKATPKSWDKAMENLKGKYPTLTDDDLLFEEEDQDELASRLQEKLGKTRREAEQIVKGMW